MAQVSVHPRRVDPYKHFAFRVKWEGRVVAGVSRISALQRVTEIAAHREGGDASSAHRSPGRTAFEPITLERGVTHDPDFENWANRVWTLGTEAGSEAALGSVRKDIEIERYNEAGRMVMAFKVYRCWVSAYEALPDVDAAGCVTAIQSVTLQHEGWKRDPSVGEPSEPATN